MTLSCVTPSSPGGPGNNGNGGVFHISQSSSITETSTSNFLMSYLVHSLRKSHPSAEMQLVYFTRPAD